MIVRKLSVSEFYLTEHKIGGCLSEVKKGITLIKLFLSPITLLPSSVFSWGGRSSKGVFTIVVKIRELSIVHPSPLSCFY